VEGIINETKITSCYDKCRILIRELRILSKDILFDNISSSKLLKLWQFRNFPL